MALTKFYDYRKINSFAATIHCIVGARGFGKTFGAEKDAITAAVNKGHEFIYLRRTDEELKTAKRTFFDAIARFFPDWDLRVNGAFAEAAPSSSRDDKKRHWNRIGHFVALSKIQGTKSVAFNLVRTIIFDEFIAEEGVQYLRNEATAFISFYETVDRGEDRVKVYMLANAVSIGNPYFVKWKIRVPKSREIVKMFLRDNGTPYLVVHFPDAGDFQNEKMQTDFGKFIAQADPEYANYAVKNEFKDVNGLMIRPKDKTAQYRYTFLTSDGNICIWYSSHTKLWYGTERGVPSAHERLFTMDDNKVTEGVTKLVSSDQLMSRLRTAWRHNRVYFDSDATKVAYLEAFK